MINYDDDTKNEYKFYRRDFERLDRRCDLEGVLNAMICTHGLSPSYSLIIAIADYIDERERKNAGV